MTTRRSGRRTVIAVGLGVTGEAVVQWALAHDRAVTVVEDGAGRGAAYGERAARARAAGARVVEDPEAETIRALMEDADMVVPSPGLHLDHAVIVAARKAGVSVRSEVDVAAERIHERRTGRGRPLLVAVTGTNGKTTVSTLVAAMVDAGGERATAAGNIGRTLLEAAEDDVDVMVAEVSSQQLELTTAAFRPDVAVWLNTAEDHLDWHATVEAYARAKARIFAHQGADGVVIVNDEDDRAVALTAEAPGRVVRFRLGAPSEGGYGAVDGQIVGPNGAVAALPVARVSHEHANAVAAAAAAAAVGVPADAIARALRDFRPLPHRVQLVGELGGVRYFDDSKATNPHATNSALRGFQSVVLIAGGHNKGLDLSVLRAHAPRLRAVVAIGEAVGEVEAVFAGVVPVARAGSMAAAVDAAMRAARPGDAVLLSPACASFDWYESYAARGDDFRREVERRVLAPMEDDR
jgi:UDP-N-acetylmuramoylalanine--D-glutamate ligase